ncbi:serine/threonine dehydratase, partial [Xanthomonas perforans]
EGAGALALAAGRRVSGKRKCAVVSGGNIDATVLATLLSEVRPRPPRKPRRRNTERLRNERSANPPPATHVHSRPSAVASTPVTAIAVEESSW